MGFIVSIIAVCAVCLFAAVLRSVNRAPAVPPALVTIWIESITSSCTSFVSPTLISHYDTVVPRPAIAMAVLPQPHEMTVDAVLF